MQLLEQVGIDLYPFELEPLNLQQRRKLFWDALERAKAGGIRDQSPVAISPAVTVHKLASTYRVDVGAIDAIVERAVTAARLRAALTSGTKGVVVQLKDIWQAAKERTRRDLGKFTRRVETRYIGEDLVLPENVVSLLYDLYTAALNRPKVYDEWGYGKQHVRGRDLCALFSGESPTGKTMSAEVLEKSLNVDLYQVDISTVVSKWLGETERNLSQIFEATEGSDAILFFDEADALFGKRTEVKESKDRYANMEVSYLLQRVEAYDGIVILASNLR